MGVLLQACDGCVGAGCVGAGVCRCRRVMGVLCCCCSCTWVLCSRVSSLSPGASPTTRKQRAHELWTPSKI